MKNMSDRIWIGIDADVEKSGIAIWTENQLSIYKMKFFKLFSVLEQYSYIKDNKLRDDLKVKVVIEAGWLNKRSNWHSSGQGENIASRIGKNVGANHQVGKLIVEMCEYLGLEYELHQPVSSKMGIRQFRMMSGYKGKLDQDCVDSALLVYGRV